MLNDEFYFIDKWLNEVRYWIGWVYGKNCKRVEYIQPQFLTFSTSIHYGVYFTLGFSRHFPFHGQSITYLGENVLSYMVDQDENTKNIQKRILDNFPGIKIISKMGECDVKLSKECRSGSIVKPTFDNNWICLPCANYTQEDNTSRAGFVYVIGNEEHGFFKIGCSKNPEQRKKAISAKLPFTTHIISKHYFGNKYMGEKQFHTKYKEYRLEGEWFALPNQEIEKLKQSQRPKS